MTVERGRRDIARPRPSATPSRRKRPALALPVLAFLACMGFVMLASVPYSGESANAVMYASTVHGGSQSVTVAQADGVEVERDAYGVTEAAPAPSSGGGFAPPAGKPDPGSAKAIAYDMVMARGWGEDQYNCLVSLWNRESGWNHLAMNRSSGAYGIPQALPGSKMASAGADWATNPATQIKWGLGYIANRYGNPCGAWAHSESVGWY